MATLDEIRQRYPDTLGKLSDTDLVVGLASATQTSPQRVAFELGMDVEPYRQNEGLLQDLGTGLKLGASELPGIGAAVLDIVNPMTYINDRAYYSELWDQVNPYKDWQERQRKVKYSPEAQQAEADVEAGFEQGLGSGLKEVLDPRYFVPRLGEILPATVAGGVAGRMVGGLATRALPAASPAAQTVKTASPYIGEGAVAAGYTTSDLLERDVDPRVAASAGGLAGLGVGAIGAGVGIPAGRYLGIGDLDASLAGASTVAANAARRPLYQRVPGSAAVELVQEGLQSPYERMVQNVATGDPLLEGTGRAMVEGGALGAIMGGGFGILPQGERNLLSNDTTNTEDPEQGLGGGFTGSPVWPPNVDPRAGGVNQDINMVSARERAQRQADLQAAFVDDFFGRFGQETDVFDQNLGRALTLGELPTPEGERARQFGYTFAGYQAWAKRQKSKKEAQRKQAEARQPSQKTPPKTAIKEQSPVPLDPAVEAIVARNNDPDDALVFPVKQVIKKDGQPTKMANDMLSEYRGLEPAKLQETYEKLQQSKASPNAVAWKTALLQQVAAEREIELVEPVIQTDPAPGVTPEGASTTAPPTPPTPPTPPSPLPSAGTSEVTPESPPVGATNETEEVEAEAEADAPVSYTGAAERYIGSRLEEMLSRLDVSEDRARGIIRRQLESDALSAQEARSLDLRLSEAEVAARAPSEATRARYDALRDLLESNGWTVEDPRVSAQSGGLVASVRPGPNASKIKVTGKSAAETSGTGKGKNKSARARNRGEIYETDPPEAIGFARQALMDRAEKYATKNKYNDTQRQALINAVDEIVQYDYKLGDFAGVQKDGDAASYAQLIADRLTVAFPGQEYKISHNTVNAWLNLFDKTYQNKLREAGIDFSRRGNAPAPAMLGSGNAGSNTRYDDQEGDYDSALIASAESRSRARGGASEVSTPEDAVYGTKAAVEEAEVSTDPDLGVDPESDIDTQIFGSAPTGMSRLFDSSGNAVEVLGMGGAKGTGGSRISDKRRRKHIATARGIDPEGTKGKTDAELIEPLDQMDRGALDSYFAILDEINVEEGPTQEQITRARTMLQAVSLVEQAQRRGGRKVNKLDIAESETAEQQAAREADAVAKQEQAAEALAEQRAQRAWPRVVNGTQLPEVLSPAQRKAWASGYRALLLEGYDEPAIIRQARATLREEGLDGLETLGRTEMEKPAGAVSQPASGRGRSGVSEEQQVGTASESRVDGQDDRGDAARRGGDQSELAGGRDSVVEPAGAVQGDEAAGYQFDADGNPITQPRPSAAAVTTTRRRRIQRPTPGARPAQSAEGSQGDVTRSKGPQYSVDEPALFDEEAGYDGYEVPNPITEKGYTTLLKKIGLMPKGSNFRVHFYTNWQDARAQQGQTWDVVEQQLTNPETGERYTETRDPVAQGASAWVDERNGRMHAHFILSRVPKNAEDALGKFLHEVGVHIGMEGMLSEQKLNNLYNKIEEWNRSYQQKVAENADASVTPEENLAARAKIRLDQAGLTDGNARAEGLKGEMIAYFVEEAVRSGVTPTAMEYDTAIGRWFRTLWAAFKVALRRLGIRNIDKLTSQNVVDLAFGAARVEMIDRWHGTAANYRRVNHDYMGSGEGAQVYGWGTYIAQRMGVGRSYMDNDVRSKNSPVTFYKGSSLRDSNDPDVKAFWDEAYRVEVFLPRVRDELQTFVRSVVDFGTQKDEQLVDYARNFLVSAIQGTDAENQRRKQELEQRPNKSTEEDFELRVAEATITAAEDAAVFFSNFDVEQLSAETPPPKEGSLFRFDVDAAPDEIMHWDKPVSEQPESLQEKVMDALWDVGVIDFDATLPGYYAYKRLAEELGTDQRASEDLDARGIKGIEHYDRASRSASDRAKPKELGLKKNVFVRVPDYEGGWVSKPATMNGVSYRAGRMRTHFTDGSSALASNVFFDAEMTQRIPTFSRKQIHAAIEENRTTNLVVFNDRNVFRVGRAPGGDVSRMQFSVNANNDELTRLREQAKSWSVDFLPKPIQGPIRVINKNLASAARKGLYSFAFTRDLIDMVEDKLPAARDLFEAIRGSQADRLAREKAVSDIVTRMSRLPAAVRRSTNNFLYDSTWEQKWGYEPEWLDDPVAVDSQMAARFEALPTAAQDIIKDINRYGHDSLREKREMINKQVTASYDRRIQQAVDEGDVDRVDLLEQERDEALSKFGTYLNEMPGPYAPLKRFGKYVVVGTSARYNDVMEEAKRTGDTTELDRLKSDPEHYWVEFAETRGEAMQAEDRLRGMGLNAKHRVKSKFRQEFAIDFRAFDRLKAAISDTSETAVSGRERRAAQGMANLLDDLILQSLSEHHARQANQARKRVAGADKDMLRAFAAQGRADAFWMSNIGWNTQINQALYAMQQQANAPSETSDDQKTEILNHLYTLYERRMNYEDSPLVNRLTAFSSLWYLLTSPAYYLQNATQPVMMTIPYLTKNFSYADATRAMTRAYADLGPMLKGKVSGKGFFETFDTNALKPEDRKIINELIDRNIIDVTIETELGAFSRDSSEKGLMGGLGKLLDETIRRLPGKLEMVNRASTALAAYRLARTKDNKSHEEAINYAERVTATTQGDYSDINAPLALTVLPGSKVLFQFRKFQLIQIAYITKLMNQMLRGKSKEEKAAATRAMAVTLGHQVVLAGAMGLPAVGTVSFFLSMMKGDDEPEDLELLARRWMEKQGVSETARDIILNGVSAPLLGSTTTAKIGMANMFSALPFTDWDLTSREGVESLVAGALGPTVGLGMQGAEAMGYIGQGDFYKGLEKLVPKGIGDPLESFRLASDGITNKRGDLAITPDELSTLDLVLNGLGLPTKVQTDRWFANRQKYAFETYFREKSAKLKNAYAKAYRKGEGLSDIRQEWRELQDARRRNGFRATPISELIKAPRTMRDRERNTAGGVQYDRSSRRFVEEMERL